MPRRARAEAGRILSIVCGKATVLCTGGAGQLYRYTTNPDVATGDGIAMAYRAALISGIWNLSNSIRRSLCYPGAPRFLISEAVRGEGAVLRNIQRRTLHGALSSDAGAGAERRRGASDRQRDGSRRSRHSYISILRMSRQK